MRKKFSKKRWTRPVNNNIGTKNRDIIWNRIWENFHTDEPTATLVLENVRQPLVRDVFRAVDTQVHEQVLEHLNMIE